MARNPFVKVALFERVATRLQDCKVVGQGDEYLLLERPAAKPRVKSTTPRKPRSKKAPAQIEAAAV